MPDKPTPVASERFSLPGHAIVAMRGADAVTFAQAQFMNDVNTLPAGHWHWNGWLSAKGRVLALFALLKFEDGTLWLLLPDGDAAALVEGLRRFVFRSKVTLATSDDLRVSGAFASAAACGGAISGNPDDGVELDLGADAGPRTLRIDTQCAPVDAVAARRWDAFDLRHGLPRLLQDQREQWTPQQLSLSRLNAYSVKKGCYPGQEIVARTHFLGQAKRGLVVLDTDATLLPGVEVRAGEQRLGSVVSTADGVALAVMGEAAEGDAVRIDGQRARVATLRGGLAR
ncbi:MAG: folate-binding protein [Pseudoxanthomonas suwonensis]|nr:folate-binding protein [Pseudoxanthomonas suwonensis]